MMEPTLIRQTLFGLAMVRLSGAYPRLPADRDIFPTQAEGELFLHLCLEQIPPDHRDSIEGSAWIGRVSPQCGKVGGSLGAPKSGSLRAPESGSLGTPKSDIRDT